MAATAARLLELVANATAVGAIAAAFAPVHEVVVALVLVLVIAAAAGTIAVVAAVAATEAAAATGVATATEAAVAVVDGRKTVKLVLMRWVEMIEQFLGGQEFVVQVWPLAVSAV